MASSWEQFLAMRAKYFEPLRVQLGLRLATTANVKSMDYASVSVATGPVRLHFRCDRGFHYFSLGFAEDQSEFCSVDAIAELFPRIRLTPGGDQRLTLEEQATFLRNNWEAIQGMFSPAHSRETRAWRDAKNKEYTQSVSRDT